MLLSFFVVAVDVVVVVAIIIVVVVAAIAFVATLVAATAVAAVCAAVFAAGIVIAVLLLPLPLLITAVAMIRVSTLHLWELPTKASGPIAIAIFAVSVVVSIAGVTCIMMTEISGPRTCWQGVTLAVVYSSRSYGQP